MRALNHRSIKLSITAQMPTCIPDYLVQKTDVLSIGINLKLFSHPDAVCESCPHASPAWSLHMRGMGLSREERQLAIICKEEKRKFLLFLSFLSHSHLLSFRAPNLSLFITPTPPPPQRSPEGEYSSVYEERSSLTSPQGLTPQSEWWSHQCWIFWCQRRRWMKGDVWSHSGSFSENVHYYSNGISTFPEIIRN